jgi:phage terminase large subunit
MIDFKCTDVFKANWQAKEKIVINQGGTSSSKTYSIVQLLYLKAISEPNIIITVTGESIPNLKKGAYRDAENIYATHAELSSFVIGWNKTDRVISFSNSSIIEFTSNLDSQSAKNGKRDYLFVNEANGIDWSIFWEMAIRTRKQIYIDYNPSAPFWCHDKLIGTTPQSNDLGASVRLIISDHRHNHFLSEDDHAKIEGIKDKYRHRVYARGLTGNLEGLIFLNWKEIPDNQFPDSDFIGGLDFGYTNDPTAGIKMARIGNNVYVHELCYKSGISANNLKSIFETNGFDGNIPIYCENDPEMISQLRRLGLRALSARKGQGSIKAGIFMLQDLNVFYTASSRNLAEERKRYMWQIDRVTGLPTNDPIDNWNHGIDALRYAAFTHYYRQ